MVELTKGMIITHFQVIDWEARVIEAHTETNILEVVCFTDSDCWHEKWNLEHTLNGIKTGEYSWRRP